MDAKRVLDVVGRMSVPAPPSGCVLWLGSVNGNGYGKLCLDGKRTDAHRAAWAARHGDIPRGMRVLHSCDVRSCVADHHHFLGTQGDNVRDMHQKGRWASHKKSAVVCGNGHDRQEHGYIQKSAVSGTRRWRCRECARQWAKK